LDASCHVPLEQSRNGEGNEGRHIPIHKSAANKDWGEGSWYWKDRRVHGRARMAPAPRQGNRPPPTGRRGGKGGQGAHPRGVLR